MRWRTRPAAPHPLVTAERWMARQRAIWERRLDQLDYYLESLTPPHSPKNAKEKQ